MIIIWYLLWQKNLSIRKTFKLINFKLSDIITPDNGETKTFETTRN